MAAHAKPDSSLHGKTCASTVREKSTLLQRDKKNGSWRYIVVLAKAAFLSLQLGLSKSLGVLIPFMVFQLNADYASVGFIVSLKTTAALLSCPLANFVLKKFNSRATCMLTNLIGAMSLIGVSFVRSTVATGFLIIMTGIFSSPTLQLCYITLRQHFGEKFGVANTASQIGGLVGGMVLPFITAKLLEAYGVDGALLCLGALLLHGVPIGATLKPPQNFGQSIEKESSHFAEDRDKFQTLHCGIYGCNGSPEDNYRPTKILEILRKEIWGFILQFLSFNVLRNELAFVLLLLPGQTLALLADLGWIYFMASFAIAQGLDTSSAAGLPIAALLGGIITRFCLSLALNYRPQFAPQLYVFHIGISAVSLFIYPLNSSPIYLWIISFFVGCGMFGGTSCYQATISMKTSDETYPALVAVSFFVNGFGAIMSGFLTGYLYEVTGSFPTTFRILSGFMALDFVLVLVYNFIHLNRIKA